MHWLPHTIARITACHIIVIIITWNTLITVTHACRVSLFLSYGSPFMLHVLLFHVTVFMLYDCFPLLILLFQLLDTWVVDMRCLLSPFPVIVFHAINRAHDMLPYLFLLYCIVIDNKENLGMGETWRLIRSYRVDVWIHCLSHCRGRGSAGYRLLLMSSHFPLLF